MAKERVSLRDKAKAKSEKMGNRSYGYLNLPDGASMFKIDTSGVKRFDIIPFIAGKNHPDTNPGDYDYEMKFFTHNNIGESGRDKVVCPKMTWGRPCPICEYIKSLSKDYKENKDEIKTLSPKARQLFNVIGKDEKIMIFDYSSYLFGNLLATRIKTEDEDDRYSAFADFEGGSTLKVNFEEKSMGENSKPFFEATTIDFKDREDYPVKIAEKAYVLDEILDEKTYKEIEKIFLAEPTSEDDDEEDDNKDKKPSKNIRRRDEDEEDEKPSKKPLRKSLRDEDEDNDSGTKKSPKKSSKHDDDESDDDEEEKPSKKPLKKTSRDEDEEDDDEEEDEKPSKKSSKKSSKRDEDEDDEEDEKPSKKSSKRDEDEEDEDEEDEKPSKKSSKKSSKRDEDEDDEEDEKPSKKSSKKSSKRDEDEDEDIPAKCPFGHKWGIDCFVHEDCDKCDEKTQHACDIAQS